MHICRLRLFLLMLISSALASCSKPQPPAPPIRAVKVMTIGASTMSRGSEYSGDVRARVESVLGFRVAGKIIRRQVQLGERVRAGQVLAQLDARDYQLAADAARAQVNAARTNRDLAAADLKRFQALREQNFISGAELEKRQATFQAAQAQLEQVQAQLASQGNQAGYTRLVADASGVVTSVDAEPGQVVSAGAPVVRVAQDGPRDVVFSVPEDRVSLMKLGSPVKVRTWGGDAPMDGRVREVAASADPVTRTYTVKVSLPLSVQPPLGSTVSISPQALSYAGTPAIKLPTSALRHDGKGTAVWVLDTPSMTLRSQPVELATADGADAVIASGLQPGMVVVTAGVHVLTAGQKVVVYQPRDRSDAPVDSAVK